MSHPAGTVTLRIGVVHSGESRFIGHLAARWLGALVPTVVVEPGGREPTLQSLRDGRVDLAILLEWERGPTGKSGAGEPVGLRTLGYSRFVSEPTVLLRHTIATALGSIEDELELWQAIDAMDVSIATEWPQAFLEGILERLRSQGVALRTERFARLHRLDPQALASSPRIGGFLAFSSDARSQASDQFAPTEHTVGRGYRAAAVESTASPVDDEIAESLRELLDRISNDVIRNANALLDGLAPDLLTDAVDALLPVIRGDRP